MNISLVAALKYYWFDKISLDNWKKEENNVNEVIVHNYQYKDKNFNKELWNTRYNYENNNNYNSESNKSKYKLSSNSHSNGDTYDY